MNVKFPTKLNIFKTVWDSQFSPYLLDLLLPNAKAEIPIKDYMHFKLGI